MLALLVVEQQPATLSGNLWQNLTGTPRGATVTMDYKYNRMNQAKGKASGNLFSASTGPSEKDFLGIHIMPQNKSYNFGTHTERCGSFRVQIAVECLVQLTEPNTLYSGRNTGAIMAHVANMFGGGQFIQELHASASSPLTRSRTETALLACRSRSRTGSLGCS